MDWSWLGTIDNPIALFAVIVFLFIGSVLVIDNRSRAQHERMMNSFLDRSEKSQERLVEVVEGNTKANTESAAALKDHTRAIHRMADIIQKSHPDKLGEQS